jgi:hypothetical protein
LQRSHDEATYGKASRMSYLPVTAMPCRLPSEPVAAGGKSVSLLQAAKHLQTKPEAVVMRKLQRNAVHQPSRSDHTDYVYLLTIARQCLRRGLPDRTTARQHDRDIGRVFALCGCRQLTVECKAHLPRGPAFQCRQWTIAEALHTHETY